MSSDLTAFLTARLDEDEAAAAGAAAETAATWHADGRWLFYAERAHWIALADIGEAAGMVIARHDPAHERRKVAAMRDILARHRNCGTGYGYCDDGGHGIDGVGCAELLDLAAIYSGHPDHKSAWAE